MRAARVIGVVAIGLLLGAASARSTASPTATVVPLVACERIVLRVAHHAAYRLVLDAISLPATTLPQVVALPQNVAEQERWRYWSKAGLIVRGGSPEVNVSIPASWRNRAAIGWGNSGAVDSLRIVSCRPSGPRKQWNAYAGGFYLRSRSACVPVIFRVGGRSAIVRFGVGRSCGTGG